MASENIASGIIDISVDDRDAIARLRSLDSTFDRTMSNIDRQSATVSIDAEIADWQDGVTQVKRQIKQLEGKKAEIELGVRKGDVKRLDAELEKARLDLKQLDGKKAEVEIKYKSNTNALKEAAREEKRLADTRKALDDARERDVKRYTKVASSLNRQRMAEMKAAESEAHRINSAMTRDAERAAKKRADAVEREAKRSASLERQRVSEMRSAESEAHNLNTRRIRDEQSAVKAQERRVNTEARVARSLNDQRARELREAENSAHRLNDAMRREADSIPSVRREYAMLGQQLEKLARKRDKMRGGETVARVVVDMQIAEAAAKMEGLKKTLERVGSPVNLDVDLHPGREAGVRLRNWLTGNQGGGLAIASAAGVHMGQVMGDGLARTFRNAAQRGVGGNLKAFSRSAGTKGLEMAGSAASRVGKGLEGLSSATVRLGPFTASIRGAISGLSILGPLLLDLVGSLGALVAVTGSAAVGVSALAGGAVVPLAAGFLGLKFSMRNTSQEVANARKTINAYQFAVEKYGAGSDKAKKKQAEMNHTLAAISPVARETALGIEKFYKNWDKNSLGTRKSLGGIAKAGFKALNDITPMWAKSTGTMAKTLETNLGGAFKFLSRGEGRGFLGNMFGNFNASLGPVLHGLGQLAAYLLKVSSLGSNTLPGLARTFDRWATGIKHTGDNTGGLNDRLQKTIDSAKSVGRFFMASGRFLKAFFSGGVSAGQDFADTMTNALNRWTAMLNSGGSKRMGDFFSSSVKGAQAFYSAIAPILSAFVQWAGEVAPLARAFFQGSSAITGFVASLLKVTALRGPITAIATTLGVMWGVGKISAATTAIMGFTKALFGMAAAESAVAAAGTGGGAAGAASALLGPNGKPIRQVERRVAGGGVAAAESAGIATMGARSNKAAREVGVLRGVATKLIPAIGGMGAIAGGVATAGLTVLAGAAVYGAYKFFTMKSGADKLRDSLKQSVNHSKAAASNYRTVGTTLGDVGAQYARTRVTLDQAQKALDKTKKGTDAHRMALMDYRDAFRQNDQARAQWMQGANKLITSAQVQHRQDDISIKKARELAKVRLENANAEARSPAGQRSGPHGGVTPEAAKKVAEARAELARLDAQAEASSNRLAAAGLNAERAYNGLPAVFGRAEQSLGKLNRQAGGAKLSKTIAMKFEAPKDVGRVAASASKSLKSGVPGRIVTKIVADSSNADQAVRRLRAARIDPKRLRILLAGGDSAISMLERIQGHKLSAKQLKVAQQGAGGVLDVLAQIQRHKLAQKVAHVRAQDAASAVLKRVDNTRIRPKTARVNAEAGQALSAISGVAGMLASLHDKTIHVNTIASHSNSNPGAGKARGIGKGGALKALVGEGNGPELIADHKTGTVMKVDSPTIMNLNKDQSVIPTESAFRQRGKQFMLQFARDMGIPAFRRGKKPRKFTEHDKKVNRRTARTTLSKKGIKNAGAYDEIKRVDNLQNDEQDQRSRIGVAEGRLNEPTTFLTKTGQDAQGNDIYQINTAEVNRWATDLDNMKKMYDDLLVILNKIKEAVDKALVAVGTSITSADSNLHKINGLEKVERGIIGKKGASKYAIAGAKVRLKEYEKAANEQQKIKEDAQGSKTDLLAEQRYSGVGSRIDEATTARDEYKHDSEAVAGKASTEQAGTVPDPPKPDAPGFFDSFDAINTKLDAETSLAAIGQGLGGGAPRDSGAIMSDQIANNQSIINAARGLLTDTDPTNDAGAYSAISSASGAISSLQGTLAGNASEAASNIKTYSTARQEIASSFGSNFSSLSSGTIAAAAMRAPTGLGTGGYGANAAGVAGGPTIVNVNNSFKTQPSDPHIWSQGVKFELQAAM